MIRERTDIPALLLTIVFMMIVAVLFLFAQILALNGVSEEKAAFALGLWLVFQVFVVALAGIFGGLTAKFLTHKFHGHKVAARCLAIPGCILLGTAFSFLSIIASFLLAGIK